MRRLYPSRTLLTLAGTLHETWIMNRGILILAVFFNFTHYLKTCLFLGPTFPTFGRFWTVLVDFCPEWTLRRIPFYVFLHFYDLKVMAGVHLAPSTCSTPSGLSKCTRRMMTCGPLTRPRQRAIQHDLGPYFWSTFVDFWPENPGNG